MVSPTSQTPGQTSSADLGSPFIYTEAQPPGSACQPREGRPLQGAAQLRTAMGPTRV